MALWLPLLLVIIMTTPGQTVELSGSVTFSPNGLSEISAMASVSRTDWQAYIALTLDRQGITSRELALSYRPGQPTSAGLTLQWPRDDSPQLTLEGSYTYEASTWKTLLRLTPAGLSTGTLETTLARPEFTFTAKSTLGPTTLQTLTASLSWTTSLSGWTLRSTTELDAHSLRQLRVELSRPLGPCTLTNAVTLSAAGMLTDEITCALRLLEAWEITATATFNEQGFAQQQLELAWTPLAGQGLSSTTVWGRRGFVSQGMMVHLSGLGIFVQAQGSFDPEGFSSLTATGNADWSWLSSNGLIVVTRAHGVTLAQLEGRLSWNEYFLSSSFNWWLASLESARFSVGRSFSF